MDKRNDTCARPLRFFLGGVLLLTLAGIALRTLNLAFFYDTDIGYYASDAPLPLIMNIFLLVAFAAIGVCSAVLPRKPYMTTGKESNIAVKVASVLCALAFAALALCTLLGFVVPAAKLIYLFIFAALVSALYFVLGALGKNDEVRALLLIALAIALVYILAVSYFDVFVQMNSPNKVILQIACLVSMLFFVYEARCITGELKRKLYLFSLSCAVFFSGVASVPSIIAYFTGKLGNYFVNINYIVFDALFAVLFIYFTVRLITMMISADRMTEETVADGIYVLPENETAETEQTDDTEEESDVTEEADTDTDETLPE
ncbi:MAG: hypothetical protein IJV72_00925 [Clostridia bacterium]|nr:hypothetical protein [Clostridia bacterium]